MTQVEAVERYDRVYKALEETAAELATVREENRGQKGQIEALGYERDQLRTKNEELKAENARLRAGLEDIIKYAPTEEPEDPESGNFDDQQEYGEDLEHYRCAQIARAALGKEVV